MAELIGFILNYQKESRFEIRLEGETEEQFELYQVILKQNNLYYMEKQWRFFTYVKLPIQALANKNNISELRTELAKNIVYRIDSGIYERGEYYIDEDGVMQILQGTAFFPDGVYQGEFFDGNPDGFGIIRGYDGYTYEGSWSDGNYSGYGELIYVNEILSEKSTEDIILSQKGNWLAGNLNGVAEIIYGDGEIIRGLHLDGVLNGYGERIFPDGIIWEGIFEGSAENLTSGRIYDQNGNLIYNGTTKPISIDGLWGLEFTGKGTVYGYNADGENNLIYIGDMRKDMAHGQGVWIQQQNRCEGRFFEDNLIEGKCTYGSTGIESGTFSTDKNGYWVLRKGTKEIISINAYHWKYEGSWNEDQLPENELLWTSLDLDTKEILEQQIFKYDKSGEFSGMSDSKNYAAFSYFNEKRIALVIGNADYSDSYGYGNLENPVNDAELMTLALEKAGFEVSYVKDANDADFIQTLAEFRSQISSAGKNVTALFYYSGHGMQVDGQNYLVPINANIQNEADLQLENISTRRIMNIFAENLNGTNIIILDACRNNPYERNFLRSSENGLSVMSAPKGTYIAYSTAPGELAADGTGCNSIFTKQLAENLLVKGITIEEVFKLTRRQVAEQTNNKQIPWSSSSLLDDFYFIQ